MKIIVEIIVKYISGVKKIIKLLSQPLSRRLESRRYKKIIRATVKEHLVLGVFYAYGSEVEGDIAEFGTGTGETAQTIAIAMRMFDGTSGAKEKN